jgi:hypothetical protein
LILAILFRPVGYNYIYINVFAEAHVGVFAKRTIPRCTQFGPFIGELVQTKEDIESTKFLLMDGMKYLANRCKKNSKKTPAKNKNILLQTWSKKRNS